MSEKNVDYLRDTLDLIKQIETRFLELGARLYRIYDAKLWEASFESFPDFLESAKISKSQASILVSIHKNYVIEGGLTQAKLAGIGYSNLYEAIPLIESEGVESAVVKASTLTRAEIKDEVRDEKHGEHNHAIGHERWGTCETCNKFIRVDEKDK